MITLTLTTAMAAEAVAYVDDRVREGGIDSAIELAPLATALRNGDLCVELSPVEADKIVVYIDGAVRAGGIDKAVELAPLATTIKEALAEFRAEPADEPLEDFAADEVEPEAASQDPADPPVIDATDDVVSEKPDWM